MSNVYRPPRGRDSFLDFTTNFFPILDNLSYKYKNIAVSGDTNADALKFNSDSVYTEYFDNLIAHGLFPLITFPTHFGPKNGSIIDHIYVKTDSNLSQTYSGISLHSFSNHLPVFTCLPIKNEIKKFPKFASVTKNDNQSYQNLKNELQAICWDDLIEIDIASDPCKNYNCFINKISEIKNKHLPTKRVKFNRYQHKLNSWITEDLLASIKRKDFLYKQYKSISSNNPNFEIFRNLFKQYEKRLKNRISFAKKNYYKQQFDKFKGDIKNTWAVIKEVLHKNKCKKNMPTKFQANGKIIEGDLKIASEFNKFFTDIGPKLASELKPKNSNITVESYLTADTRYSFKFDYVTSLEIQRIINKLLNKSSSGFDHLSSSFIKKIGPFICYPLSKLINQSLFTGVFPEKLKIAKVIPLHKKDDDNTFDNYRPISLLPVFSKIYEKIVFKQLYNYMNSNNLLFESQHGFRQKFSTETAILELTDHLKTQIDNKHIPLCLFLDLSKAFDTIDFDIILIKLKRLGIKNIALKWFESYLKNRQQFVSFNGTDSEYTFIKTGVPQGSVLGPLLFLIYMNDLNNVSPYFKLICFADDSNFIMSICFSERNCSFCQDQNKFDENLINVELNKIYDWLCINKLSIQVKKTKYIFFKNAQKSLEDLTLPILKINGKILEKVSEFRYLGIILDENLSFCTHISNIGNKISKTIGILCRLKNTVPKFILKTIYNSLINPHLNYCILGWGLNNNIDRLIILQKRAVRIITHSHILAHTGNLFKELKILKIEDIIKLQQLIFYHKFLHYNLPPTLSNLFIKQPENLRSCHSSYFLKPPIKANTEMAKKCIRHSLPTFINSFNNNIDENDPFNKAFIEEINHISIFVLKKKFKSITFEKYAIDCIDQNCYPCFSRFFSPFGFAGTLKYLHIFYHMMNFKYHKPYLSTGILEFLNIQNYIQNYRMQFKYYHPYLSTGILKFLNIQNYLNNFQNNDTI